MEQPGAALGVQQVAHSFKRKAQMGPSALGLF